MVSFGTYKISLAARPLQLGEPRQMSRYGTLRTWEASTEAPRDAVKLKLSSFASKSRLFGHGNIIGAGIFVLTGHAAAENAGPAITLSYVLGAVVCGLSGLCYAELASAIPTAGSSYTYAYATLGEIVARRLYDIKD